VKSTLFWYAFTITKIVVDDSISRVFSSEVFDVAIANAEAFICRPEVILGFQANVSDFNPGAFEEALKRQYALKTIQRKLEMDRFSYTYHHDPCSIYFNSFLLANTMRKSTSASDDVHRTRTNK
jgi:hypothetical protein